MGSSDRDANVDVTELREEAARLAGSLPGELRRLRLKTDGASGEAEVEVEWQDTRQDTPAPPPAEAAQPAEAAPPEPGADGRTVITSPMVGTFYRAPEPGADPFVSEGDVIEPDQVVGIVEAMKLMNPINAETGGRVTKILVDNAEAVDFGRPLIELSAEAAGS